MSKKTTTLFCHYCNNLLESKIFIDNYKLICNVCGTTYEPNEYDSLIFEESNMKIQNINIHKKIIDIILKDPTAIKIKKKCLKCGNLYAKTSRLGEEMKLIKICLKCKHFE